MAGLSPKLPLYIDPSDGPYGLNKTYEEMIRQNLKMLILTSPGERMMDPLFGVGIRRFLFQQNSELTYQEIEIKIREQSKKYMPFIDVEKILFIGPEKNGEQTFIDQNFVRVSIYYNIIPLNLEDALSIDLEV